MFESVFRGSWRYYMWLGFLALLIGLGVAVYINQFIHGLGVTGLSRDIPWGFYIAQFTFMVGVAASAVMVVLPYYLHNYKEFGKITILGEFLAIPAVILCMLFVFVDMGQPIRVANVLLHPTPNSVMFWDIVVLSGYLVLNVVIARVTFEAERKGVAPPKWIKPVIILSIPWAVSIHTVTAFLYSGLSGRAFWLTAILAPRFLASAFASGPALLILLCLALRRFSKFDAGDKAILKLAQIVAYAMCINVFFILLEIFTAFYAAIPEHMSHFQYLYVGLHGDTTLVPWMWTSTLLAVVAILGLVIPRFRMNIDLLGWICLAVIISIWIDKGMGMVLAGLTPSPLEEIPGYSPTATEWIVGLGVYAIGAFLLTVLYKVALSIREKKGA